MKPGASHAPSGKVDDLRLGDGQAERGDQLKAEIFVLDAVGEIDAVRQRADMRLDDMGRRGRAMRHMPFVIPVEQCGFFLRAGKRYPELLIGADAERIARKIVDGVGDFLVGRCPGVERPRFAGVHALGQELKCANAVAADRRE